VALLGAAVFSWTRTRTAVVCTLGLILLLEALRQWTLRRLRTV
jgi:hypothetical protein